ncbi:hypothetical protein ScPMuIL_012232 [Solemya velum]
MAFLLLVCYGVMTVTNGLSDQNMTIMDTNTRLLRTLLRDYDKRVVPRVDSNPLDVRVYVQLRDLVEVVEDSNAMETSLVMSRTWRDPRLTWNDSLNSGISFLRLPISVLWLPDFWILNSYGPQTGEINDGVIFLHNSGTVFWFSELHARTGCFLDMTNFPYDQHTCSLVMGAWWHSKHLVTISSMQKNDSVVIDNGFSNKEWTLLNSLIVLNNVSYSCCPEVEQDITVSLTIKRNSKYYAHVVVLPAVLLAMLVPFQFLLPAQSEERITLGCVLMLAIVYLLLTIQGALSHSHTVPVVSMYYSLTLIWLTISVMTSILAKNLENRGPRRAKVPDILRQVFLKGLKRLLCSADDSYYVLDEREIMTMRGLNKSLVKLDRDPKQHASIAEASSKLEQDVEEINRMVHGLAVRSSVLESREEITNEWKQLVLVIDRLLFCVFLFVFVMYTLILLA